MTVATAATMVCRSPDRSRAVATLHCLYNWCVWALLAVLLFCQALLVVWNSVSDAQHTLYGQPPTEGKYNIPGYNDEPYADRTIVCVTDGYLYRPMQLSEAIRQYSNASAATSNGVDGYRVVVRTSNVITNLGVDTFPTYSQMCDTLALTMDSILDACDSLGYNVSRDVLRIVHGLETDTVTVLPRALPIMLVPLWDRAFNGRFVVPGRDGSACVFRGSGFFTDATSSFAYLTAAPRAIREGKTIEWLGYPGGVWRNGWYEHSATQTKWHADVVSTVRTGDEHLPLVQFDLLSNSTNPIQCPDYNPVNCVWSWGNDFWGTQLNTISVRSNGFFTVAVSNGLRFGLFIHDSADVVTVSSTYGLDQLISNVTIAMLLVRWLVALFALSKSHETIGVGALANAPTFRVLPLLLLPRLKSTLQAFWTAGCQFEGAQKALGEAWFAVYPAIGETVLLYFSLLNLLAKVLRRRVSDMLFGPTLMVFGLLHYFRLELAASTRLGFDGRVSTIVTAQEVDDALVTDFFTSDLPFLLNGRVTSLFAVKLAVLALNLVPLIVGSRDVRVSSRRDTTQHERNVEKAIAMRFNRNGGLGLAPGNHKSERKESAAQPYEFVRAGYVIVNTVGQSVAPSLSPVLSLVDATASAPLFAVSIDHWLGMLFAPSKLGMRVAVFEAHVGSSKPGGSFTASVDATPLVCFTNDFRFRSVRPWRVVACAVE